MPSTGSVPAHSLDYCVVHLCQNFRNKRGGRVTAKESQSCILAEIEQLKVNGNIQFCDICQDHPCLFRNKDLYPIVNANRNSCNSNAISGNPCLHVSKI